MWLVQSAYLYTCMDKATEARRVQFDRVCIEIGLEDDFPESIILDIEGIGQTTVYIEYPWKHVVCSVCGKYGHNDKQCTGVTKVWKPKVTTQGHTTSTVLNKQLKVYIQSLLKAKFKKSILLNHHKLKIFLIISKQLMK